MNLSIANCFQNITPHSASFLASEDDKVGSSDIDDSGSDAGADDDTEVVCACDEPWIERAADNCRGDDSDEWPHDCLNDEAPDFDVASLDGHGEHHEACGDEP